MPDKRARHSAGCAAVQRRQLSPRRLAKLAGLRYADDRAPGIRRRRAGRGFAYFEPSGGCVRQAAQRQRIDALAIPPAWRDVWICPWPDGHLQATGRDSRGRKQYIYHQRWREMAGARKFNRLHHVGRLLPRIRRRVERDFQQRGHGRQKVLAGMIRLLDKFVVRIGNEEYTAQNSSYGLTTLRDRHVQVNGTSAEIQFRGKGGLEHNLPVKDARLVRFLRTCREVEGERLFVYRQPDGKVHEVRSEDVNQYLQEISGQAITAKDFRTWKATALVAARLSAQPEPPSQRGRMKIVLDALDEAAQELGNTRSICRNYYVHPAIVDSYLCGNLTSLSNGTRPRRSKWLDTGEQITLQLLARFQESKTRRAGPSNGKAVRTAPVARPKSNGRRRANGPVGARARRRILRSLRHEPVGKRASGVHGSCKSV